MSLNPPLETYSDHVAWELAEYGVEDAFVVTGGAIGPFTNSIVRQGRIKMHYLLTEQSAGIAAEAYGYASGKPALLIVTSGPGVTNALTAVAAAWTNSSPMIVISGQARSTDVTYQKNFGVRQMGNQHVRTDLIVEPIVKAFFEPIELLDAKQIIKALYESATEGRQGPTWLSLPQDIQRSSSQEFLEIEFEKKELATVESSIISNSIASKLISSVKPAILLGNGARPKINEILQFAKKHKIPIMTTWPG